MTYIVLFEDDPDADPDTRKRHMPAHLAFLENNASEVRAAGPLKSTDDAPAGGIWIVESADPARVEALVREDPFWPTGLRKSHRILLWTRVFADGARLISP